MSESTIRRAREVRAKTTFSARVRETISGSRPGSFFAMGFLDGATEAQRPQRTISRLQMLKKISGMATMYFRLKRPAQDHLDGQRDHAQQQHDEHRVAPGAQLVVELLEPDGQAEDLVAGGQQPGQHAHVEEDKQDAGQLAHQHVAGQAACPALDPEVLGEVDVVQRFQLVQVPVLVGAEEVPVGAAQERAQHHEQHPQDQEAEQEQRDLELALLEGEVAVALGVHVDVRDGHEAHDDQAGEHHARQPGIEVDQHLLQPQEVPGRLGGVGRARGVGRLLDGRRQRQAPDHQHDHADDHAEHLGVDEVRPDPGLLGFLRRALDRGLAGRDARVVLVRLAAGSATGRSRPGRAWPRWARCRPS